jgi:hypothetical protein
MGLAQVDVDAVASASAFPNQGRKTSGCAGEWDWRPGATSAGLLLGLALGTGVGAAELVTSRCCLS